MMSENVTARKSLLANSVFDRVLAFLFPEMRQECIEQIRSKRSAMQRPKMAIQGNHIPPHAM